MDVLRQDAVAVPQGGFSPELDAVDRPVSDRKSALPRKRVLGFDFVAADSLAGLTDELLAYRPVVAPGVEPLVATPNVDYVVKLARPESAALAQRLRSAEYVLPDGMPIVWASRVLGARLPARLPGSDLFTLLWTRLIAERRAVLVLAPSDDVAARLREAHPAACTVVPPFFDHEAQDEIRPIVDACVHEIVERDVEIVVTAISFPGQQKVAFGILDQLSELEHPLPLILMLGASPEFHLGLKKRAPVWMQRRGMEWLHRFASEPRRLFHRYFVEDVAFVRIVWREWRRQRA